MKPAIVLNVQYPGDLVSNPGVFRVRHSIAHYPQVEAYLYAGLCLPDCTRLGCHVIYAMIKPISHEDYLRQNDRDSATSRGGHRFRQFVELTVAKGHLTPSATSIVTAQLQAQYQKLLGSYTQKQGTFKKGFSDCMTERNYTVK